MGTLPEAKTSCEIPITKTLDETVRLCVSSNQQVAHPVVYKLVRVEGDGRLVPATDDEVMAVEDFLDDERSQPASLEEARISRGFLSDEISLKKPVGETTEGRENIEADAEKLNARLEFIEEMLQRVKQEERLRLSCGYPDRLSKFISMDEMILDKHDQEPYTNGNLKEENPVQDSAVNARLINTDCVESKINEMLAMSTDDPITSSALLNDCTGYNPDISTTEGEICLDSLSIRELQETFKSTFGRTTSVKDKLWLKRRIAMGLTNSYDVPTTNFVIKGKTLISKKVERDGFHDAVGDTNEHYTDMSVRLQHCQVSSSKGLRKPRIEVEDSRNCEYHEVQTAGKRIRKPTKRYIEELSEVETRECSGRLGSSGKSCRHSHDPQRFQIGHLQGDFSSRKMIVTRNDSLGGSGVQVPYVSRVRRGRPRQNFMALMKYQPSGIAAEAVEEDFGMQISRQQGDIESFQTETLSQQIQQASGDKLEKQMVIDTSEQLKTVDMENADSSADDTSDENVATVPTANGGTRRKHHRAWTLSEVVKLVEGVSRYGAGRWSEIKRLAFASYSYRTSVDLKDKWRNLLRASFSQVHANKGVKTPRKHAAIPIPAPILIRVRELAEMHGQTNYYPSSSKLVGKRPSKNVHEIR
ncbi:hypothetical protein H6P81_002203 [Aristolochia fimbriata]|uniref:Uncharacterized protein n=1 Tax=Aristolochia fimbriata TaxID=158543 RepID=A0AAV7F939_ARIFI|nr:hypothetical protein H6P81_002203 [Aristolochia fimbriata]